MRLVAGQQHTLKLRHKCQQHMTTTSIGRQFAYNIINIMAKRIGESTKDDSHVRIFAEVAYDWWCREILRYTATNVRRYQTHHRWHFFSFM